MESLSNRYLKVNGKLMVNRYREVNRGVEKTFVSYPQGEANKFEKIFTIKGKFAFLMEIFIRQVVLWLAVV
jgi:hypothetical protein